MRIFCRIFRATSSVLVIAYRVLAAAYTAARPFLTCEEAIGLFPGAGFACVESMTTSIPRLSTCLWFDSEAEDAARFYVSIFPNSRIDRITHYTEAGKDIHGRPAGFVMTVEFELAGRTFRALNGGPIFKFNESVSIEVICDSQSEIDFYWSKLTANGAPSAQQCGWLKDRFGLSWQIVPRQLAELMADDDRARASRVMTAMLKMKKLDLAELESAAASRHVAA